MLSRPQTVTVRPLLQSGRNSHETSRQAFKHEGRYQNETRGKADTNTHAHAGLYVTPSETERRVLS